MNVIEFKVIGEGMDWAKYFKTHGDFVLAQLKGSEYLYEVAVNVLCLHQGRVLNVDDLMLQCPQFNPSRQDFETWVFETKKHALAIAELLTGVSKEALLYVLEEDIREQKMNYINAMENVNKLKAIVENNMKDQ